MTEAAQLPDRPPDAELPTADLSEKSLEGATGTSHSDNAVSQGPSPAAVPPRYSLRDRSKVKQPDFLTYK